MSEKIKEHLAKVRRKMGKEILFSMAAGAIVTGGPVAADYYDKETKVLHTENMTDIINHQLFKAASENDIAGFKQALKKGATVTMSNRHNQNVLMIALAYDSYDVSDYILTTPELRDRIDYKQSDDKGVTATGIINIKLEKTKDIDNFNKLIKTKDLIDGQMLEQLAKEAEGYARSDTKYDAFIIATQNALKKGNTGK